MQEKIVRIVESIYELNLVRRLKYKLINSLMQRLINKHGLKLHNNMLRLIETDPRYLGLTNVFDNGEVDAVYLNIHTLDLKYRIITETLRHELGHVLHMNLKPYDIKNPDEHHGNFWGKCAKQLGADPEEHMCSSKLKTCKISASYNRLALLLRAS